jgi:S-disulfanyl-L-cysteine oxidoreductase SoxD
MSFKFGTIAVIGLAAAGVYFIHAQDPTKSVWDGVYTDEQAKRGQSSYAEECASCHGDQLTGGEMAPPLAGGEFMSNWSGLTVGDLYERIRTGMPPNAPAKVNRDAKADIVAFILAFNKFPTGKDALPSRTEMLKMIRIDATKK